MIQRRQANNRARVGPRQILGDVGRYMPSEVDTALLAPITDDPEPFGTQAGDAELSRTENIEAALTIRRLQQRQEDVVEVPGSSSHHSGQRASSMMRIVR